VRDLVSGGSIPREIMYVTYDSMTLDKRGFCAIGPNTKPATRRWSGISRERTLRDRRRVASVRSARPVRSLTHRDFPQRVLARDKFYPLSRTRSSAPLISNVRNQRRRGPFASRGTNRQEVVVLPETSSYLPLWEPLDSSDHGYYACIRARSFILAGSYFSHGSIHKKPVGRYGSRAFS